MSFVSRNACPPEDCGGFDAYHARRDEATGLDAIDDLVLVAEFVERVVLGNDSSWSDDDETRWRVEMAAERIQFRARFLEEKFSRGAVNRGFRSGAHRRLMYQQTM